jgi:hypothetical protein
MLRRILIAIVLLLIVVVAIGIYLGANGIEIRWNG